MNTYLVTFRDGSTLITHAIYREFAVVSGEQAFRQYRGWHCLAVKVERLES